MRSSMPMRLKIRCKSSQQPGITMSLRDMRCVSKLNNSITMLQFRKRTIARPRGQRKRERLHLQLYINWMALQLHAPLFFKWRPMDSKLVTLLTLSLPPLLKQQSNWSALAALFPARLSGMLMLHLQLQWHMPSHPRCCLELWQWGGRKQLP